MILSYAPTYGAFPAGPDASRVALEASVSQEDAAAMIEAAWQQAETFTGRTFRVTESAELIVRTEGPDAIRWPRQPAPASVTAERFDGDAWVPDRARIVAGGWLDIEGKGIWKLTAENVPANHIGGHVVQAVVCLALYQLIHSPARREFRSQSAGDTSVTREALAGLFWASGAGALLSSEVVL